MSKITPNTIDIKSAPQTAAGAPVTVGTNPPTGVSIEGAIHLVTDDGTPTGTVLEQYIYDTDSGVWIEMQRNAQDTLKFGTASPTSPGEWDGEEFFVTSDGTHAGDVLEQWIWDKQSSTWIQRPTPVAVPETTSLTPVVWNGTSFVNAQADSDTKVADLMKLADGTYLHDGKVSWPAHGLTVGSWYYLSQATAGGVVTPAPTSGLAQQLFFVESADTVHVDIEEAYQVSSTASTASPSFTNTVYVNATSPTTATIFDTANPPATNNNALKANVNNLYIGTDGSTWTYNSATSTYGTYVYPASVPAGVFAQLPANFAVANMSGVPVTGYTTVNNTAGAAWNPANGLFTAPRSGWYDINGSLLFASSNWNAGAQASIGIQLVPGAIIASGQSATLAAAVSNAQISTAHVQTKIYLNAGQGVRLLAYQNSGSAKATGSPINNIISITEVR